MGIVEIAKKFIDLMFIPVNAFFNMEFDLYNGVKVKYGVMVLALLFVFYTIYFILRALKIIGDDD